MDSDVQEAFARGLAFHRAGNLAEAEKLYRQVLSRQANHADAIHLLGVMTSQRGRHEEALQLISRAIALNPPSAGEYYCNYGLALASLGRHDQAISAYRQSIALRPDLAATHSNLAQMLIVKGKLPEAIVSFREAIRLQPENAEPYVRLGHLLLAAGQMAEALEVLQRSVQLSPGNADALHALGNVFFSAGNYVPAIEAYRRAIAVRPDYAESYTNLGKALNLIEQIDEAIEAFRRALKLRPNYADAANALGNAYKDLARLPQALDCYNHAVKFDPDFRFADSNRVYSMYFSPVYDGPGILAEAKIWNERHRPAVVTKSYANDRAAGRRLRVGYVSPNFRNHCQALFTGALFANHDRANFEIFCYADLQRADRISEKIRSQVDTWRLTGAMTDQALAERVLVDRIDILVDLTMHMGDGRLNVFARRPAPVQVAYLAYTGTTGVSGIGYRLTDPYLDPPGENDGHYSEESIRLPDTFWCYDPLGMELGPGAVPEPGPLPASKNGYVTFGCLNNFTKVHDGVLAAWARVLQGTPGSRLLLLAPVGSARAGVLESLGRNGIAAERIDFVARQSRASYLNEFNRIDVCLDTFPCNGHTTSLDSFWMGVPVVTRLGPTAMGRAGWSQLSNIGHTELAARSDDEFVKIAVELAADIPRLTGLHESLRRELSESPIMDGPRFVRGVEAAFRGMWERWVASK